MTFTGHFTGKFGPTQGKGQPIEFIATNLVKVKMSRSPTTGTLRIT